MAVLVLHHFPALSGLTFAEPPLHEQIDALIAAKTPLPAAAKSSDAEFLRRITLDLTGEIPTADVARQFLEAQDPDKRRTLINRLLASPKYARRMQEVITVMLLERRTGNDVPATEWEEYLHQSFAANKPWDQLVREVLAADSNDPVVRPAMKFYLDRGAANHDLWTRDVGRLFLGRDMQCAQCHDHPVIGEYRQSHYQGLFAFLSRSYLHKHPQTQQAVLAEKADGGKIDFHSVFLPDEKHSTGPRLLDGAEIEVPMFEKGKEFAEPPADGKPGIPRFRPRLLLVDQLLDPAQKAFPRTSANRFWFLMMGRGLVHPLDLHHAGNPPSHPELLDSLAAKFPEMKFDIRAFLRELALSETYQRSSLVPDGQASPTAETFLVANAKRLSAEQLLWSTLVATGELEHVLRESKEQAAGPPSVDSISNSDAAELMGWEEIRKKYLVAFANPPGEAEVTFEPSVAGALFVAHDFWLLERLVPRPGNLVDRLQQISDDHELASELYLSVLTRYPTDEERADVADYLAQSGDARTAAIQDLVWSLLASTEFCVNH